MRAYNYHVVGLICIHQSIQVHVHKITPVNKESSQLSCCLLAYIIGMHAAKLVHELGDWQRRLLDT